MKDIKRNKERLEDMMQFLCGMMFLLAICWFMVFIVILKNDRKHIGETDVAAVPENSLASELESENETGKDMTSTEEAILETESQEPPMEVSIMAVGDNLMHASVSYSGLQEDGSWDFSGLFAHIQSDIQEADVAILCQEVIMGGLDLGISGYPSFNTVQELGHSIVDAGFHVVALANNHTLDKGVKGILRTIDFWKTNYPEFCYVGIHESQEERNQISIIEKEGIKIAILNYTYGLNGRALPAGQEYLINLLDNQEQMLADIQKAKALADFVIVMPHWGTEYSFDIDAKQQELTRLWADNGVDLVIGSHAHVVQPVEWVQREGYANPMLVYYSLGNFVSIQDKKEKMLGAMAKIAIQKQNGETFISDHSMKILVTHYESHAGEQYFTNVTTYPLEDYTPELAAQHGIKTAYDASFSYESVTELAQWLLNRVD